MLDVLMCDFELSATGRSNENLEVYEVVTVVCTMLKTYVIFTHNLINIKSSTSSLNIPIFYKTSFRYQLICISASKKVTFSRYVVYLVYKSVNFKYK